LSAFSSFDYLDQVFVTKSLISVSFCLLFLLLFFFLSQPTLTSPLLTQTGHATEIGVILYILNHVCVDFYIC
jgi:hypothetical protein